MKNIYTEECKETPKGATHYKNIGQATFFYQIKGFKVLKYVMTGWKTVDDKNFNMSLMRRLEKPALAKKLFKFTGSPENQIRHNITSKAYGSNEIEIDLPAYKDDEGRTVWITHDHEVIRNEHIAAKIGREIKALKDSWFMKKTGVKPKAKKRVTVTRTISPDCYYHSVRAG